MEGQGLVKREGDPDDARIVRVRATAKGIRLLQEGRARRIARLQVALEELPSRDLAALARATEVLQGVVRGL
jgi:DNA-binding MarR family transcriptional regulator